MPAPGQMAPHRDNAHFAKMLEALNDKSEPTLRTKWRNCAKRLPRCGLNWPRCRR